MYSLKNIDDNNDIAKLLTSIEIQNVCIQLRYSDDQIVQEDKMDI